MIAGLSPLMRTFATLPTARVARMLLQVSQLISQQVVYLPSKPSSRRDMSPGTGHRFISINVTLPQSLADWQEALP